MTTNVQTFAGPRYTTNVPDGVGNLYQTLGDDWGAEQIMPGLDQVIVDVSLAAGFEAQMQFGSGEMYGPAIPLKVGVSAWDELKRYGFDRVRFRNADAAANAEIIVQVYGV